VAISLGIPPTVVISPGCPVEFMSAALRDLLRLGQA